jgi:methylthioribose-1-phosphate isomerase
MESIAIFINNNHNPKTMNINGKHYRTIWEHPKDEKVIQIIDQRPLPHKFVIENLYSVSDFCRAIKDMHVRGAGLIGATAGYGMYMATLESENEEDLKESAEKLKATRPTAVNLQWAVDRQLKEILSSENKIQTALKVARDIADEDAAFCKQLGLHGLELIEEIAKKKDGVVNILTHCNAGWLAFVDYGSATAPIYAAHDKGIKVHVWVDETRPRNQGARLTAWELGQHGVPHTIIPDNVGGHLMQHGKVDLVIVGTDRTTYTGDVANKIGTYLKALAAKDNDVPFYVALPSSSFDWTIKDGVKEIPIEERGDTEVKYIQGLHDDELKKVLLTPKESPATNFAFDVTPARLVTGLITERGVCDANEKSILELYPDMKGDESMNDQKTDDGYVKFNQERIKANHIRPEHIEKINKFRQKFYDLKLIGMYNNGVGYGNISQRTEAGFIISGTKTGGKKILDENDYTEVVEIDLDKNSLKCKGAVDASSESMTHGSFYEASKDINAVIHIHNKEFWQYLLNQKAPTTSEKAKYGTPEMAYEILRLFKETDVAEKKIVVMAGHEEGVIAFGKNLDEAADILLEHFQKQKE